MRAYRGDAANRLASRRDFLCRGGGLVLTGYVAPALATALPAVTLAGAAAAGKAHSCIFIYLLGGPPHLDMFDLKPAAPAEIRGLSHRDSKSSAI